MITPITVQEAIKHLDRDEDHAYADAMITNLELGYVEAGRDENGDMHFKITEAGIRRAEHLIRHMGGRS